MFSRSQIEVNSRGRGTIEITEQLHAAVAASDLETGICNVFIEHTSASLLICENADPDVLIDLETFIGDLVVDGDPRFVHDAEGPDDMAAHIRSVLTQSSISIPFEQGRLLLGTWQGVFLWEHRTRGHLRKIICSLYGEARE